MKTQDYHKTIGIAGAGQLGQMMILESRGLPLKFNVYCESPNDPAAKLADKVFGPENYKEFVNESDVVTFEFEHINPKLINYAESRGKLRPSYKSVALKMERHKEKEFLRGNNFPVGDFIIANGGKEALLNSRKWEKFVIKTSTGGYDGKGQYYWNDLKEFPESSDEIFVVEKFIQFQYEASIICARDIQHKIYFFEPSFNYNRKGILISNIAPLDDKKVTERIKEISRDLLNALEYIGVMGIEFFITEDGPIINEYAPRVHNTGHHTLMGSSISQFEFHIRAVANLPMFKPETYRPSGIVNIIGINLSEEQLTEILSLGNTRVYDYGKSPVKRKRKMGHVCITANSNDELRETQKRVITILYGAGIDNFI